MPRSAPRPCNKHGCPRLTNSKYCEDHKTELYSYDNDRENSNARGYDAKWRKARSIYLSNHPLCVQHEAQGQVVAATVVDHIIPHKGDKYLFRDQGNWQSLCKQCHDVKTAIKDGGIGSYNK